MSARRLSILFSSAVFHPRTGGIERVTQALAEGALERGHEVVVATQEPHPGGEEPFAFPVVRNPSSMALWRLARKSNVVVFGGTSLRTLWPALCSFRPIVTGHHNWYQIPGRHRTYSGWMKIKASRFSSVNVACSRSIAFQLPVVCEIVNSFYDDAIFRPDPSIERTGDLIAVGRLVSDKGFDVLIEALAILAREGAELRLSLVGSGPEKANLEELARRRGVAELVTFHGNRSGENLKRLLCAHRVLVVPSRWPEPFGIVVGEGLACGCLVIGSTGGGLLDAMGLCGVPFRSEDAIHLAKTIRNLLDDEARQAELLSHVPAHLETLKRSHQVPLYLDLIERAAGR